MSKQCRFLGTASVGGAVGRLVPIIGWGITVAMVTIDIIDWFVDSSDSDCGSGYGEFCGGGGGGFGGGGATGSWE